MPEHDEPTQLMPQHFRTMQEGYDDPTEVMAVQRFMLRVGGPTIAMKLMPGGADGKFDKRMANAVEAYQDKFGIETPNKGQVDMLTTASMSELRAELSAQDRRPDVVEHLLGQMPPLPKHHLEKGDGPQADLRSAQYHALDAAKAMKAQKPGEHVTEFIQEVLASRGYSLGAAGLDGKPSNTTIAALQDYQRDAGLLPTGFLKDGSLDPATLEMMRMDETRLDQRKLAQRPRIDAPAGIINGITKLNDALASPPPATDDYAAAQMAKFGMTHSTDKSRENLEVAKLEGRNYQTGGGLLNGNIAITVGPVVDRGLFGPTVSSGIRLKLF